MIGNPRFGSLGTAQMPVKTLDTLQPIYGIAAFFLALTLQIVAVVALNLGPESEDAFGFVSGIVTYAALVAVVLTLFLFNLRTALISITAIPDRKSVV